VSSIKNTRAVYQSKTGIAQRVTFVLNAISSGISIMGKRPDAIRRDSRIRFLLATYLVFFAAGIYAGPFAPAAGQAGTTAIDKDSLAFTAWATGWTGYQAGTDVDAGWQTPQKALGKAVGDSFDVVSLGNGGSITLTFTQPIANGEGSDFAVFENSFSDTFLELACVEVSSNGADFYRFPNYSYTSSKVGAFGATDPTNISGLAGKYRQGYGTPFDLSELAGIAGLDLNNIGYVRIKDILGNGTDRDSLGNPIYDPYKTTGSAGFDLDAIGVIHQASRTQGSVAETSALNCGAATPSRAYLWPPSKEFKPVRITGITGPIPYGIRIESVHQDEPVRNRALRDKTGPDAKVVAPKAKARKTQTKQQSVFLRAERQGLTRKGQPFTGNGRVYTIRFTADDGYNPPCSGQVTVQVPATKGVTAIMDLTEEYDSLHP